MSSTTTKKKKVAIIGPTGRLGRDAVMQLSSRGIPTRCLLRHDLPKNSNEVPKSIDQDSSSRDVASYLATLPGVEMVKGDVTNKASLINLLSDDCTSILALHGAKRTLQLSDLLPWTDPESEPSHAKQTNYIGVANIIDAVKASKTCERIVRVTGKGEDPWGIFSILINLLGGMAKAWNYEGEELLRQSSLPYTIIRPGVMSPTTPSSGSILTLADNGADLKVSPIAHSSIASLCIDCLDYDNAANATLTAMTVPEGEGESEYGPLLERVRPDTRVFPKSLMDEHRRAVRIGGVGLGVVLLGFLGGFVALVRGVLGLLGI